MPVIAAIGAGVSALGGAGAVAAAGASVVGGVLSANAQKDAANASNAAYQQASQQQLAAQQKAMETAQANNQPYMNTGYSALDALSKQLMGGGTTTDYGSYLSANPDVAQFANDAVSQKYAPPGWSGGVIDTPEEAAQYHYQTYGQGEGRAAPTTTTTQQQISDARAPVYQQAKTYSAPGAPDVSKDAYAKSGYYQLGLKTGMDNLNANFGARGLLKSGAAIQGATDFGQQNFAKNYGDFYNQQMDLYKTQLNQFNADRSAELNQLNTSNSYGLDAYKTERVLDTQDYNTNTSNLYNLASMGQQAAGNVTQAASQYANNAGNIYGNQAASTAARATANAGTTADLYGSLAGSVGNLFSNAGTKNAPAPVQSADWNVGGYGNMWNKGAYY